MGDPTPHFVGQTSATPPAPTPPQTPKVGIGTTRLTGSRALAMERLRGVSNAEEMSRKLDQWRPSTTETSGGSRFSFDKVLGEGAQGVVYSILDRDTRRHIALKTLRGSDCVADDVSRFIHEVQVTAQLEHPGIVPVHDFDILDDGTVVYTMKRVEGLSLAEHLKGRSGAPNHRFDLLHLFLKICDTIAFAHSRDVIHRDLKPRNIMVGHYGEVLVMDWGLAKVLPSGGKRSSTASSTVATLAAQTPSAPVTSFRSLPDGGQDAYRTVAGYAVGTPAYMSPEQARGEQERVDRRSDVYALGVILYEILSGASPYIRGDVNRTLEQVATGKLQPITSHPFGAKAPRALAAIAAKAMALHQRDRYQSVEALAGDLRNFLAGLAVSAHRESPWEATSRLLRKHRVLMWAVAAAALAALAGGSLLWWRAELAADQAVAALRAEAGALELAANVSDLEAAAKALREANQRYDRILGLRPGHPVAIGNIVRLEGLIKTINDRRRGEADRLRADELASQAAARVALGGEADLVAAQDLYAQAQQLAPTTGKIIEAKLAVAARLAELRRDATEKQRADEAAKHTAAALAAETAGDLDSAILHQAKSVALVVDPVGQGRLLAWTRVVEQRREQERQTALAKERAAQQEAASRERRSRADAALTDARTAAAAGHGREAQESYDRALGIDPLHPGLPAVALVAAAAIAKERADAADGLRHQAATWLTQAAEEAEEIQVLDGTIRDLQAKLVESGEPVVRAELQRAELDRSLHQAKRAHALAEGIADLQQALAVAPDHPPVRADLASYHLDRLREAEAAGDVAQVAAAEAQAKAFANPADQSMATILSGLTTVRAAADASPVRLTRLAPQADRRLEPTGDPVTLAPGGSASIPVGRWLVETAGPGGRSVCVRRFDRRGADYELNLPPPPALPPGVAWIPAGRVFGPDGRSAGPVVAAFALAIHEVTCGEWLAFLNDPKTLERHAAERAAGTIVLAPRDSLDADEPIWLQDSFAPWNRFKTPFRLEMGLRDRQKELVVKIDPRCPVAGISAEDADAYVAWRRDRDRLPWRLPTLLEWQLAAQGGDGRTYPWGDAADLGFCHSALTADRGRSTGPVPVGSHGEDRSVQGVLGLAGSVAEMIAAEPGHPRRTACGGSFADRQPERFATTSRREHEPRLVSLSRGLRLALGEPAP
ncbi:hypothetical protein LBMAG53_28730 [Planctomycetota bacterium]|nr:hypothetical protein LBMAG53_28730 [Planctomycetota bacterium]